MPATRHTVRPVEIVLCDSSKDLKDALSLMKPLQELENASKNRCQSVRESLLGNLFFERTSFWLKLQGSLLVELPLASVTEVLFD